MKVFESFSELLDYLIDSLGITNRQFADLYGKNESQISKWLNDYNSNPQRKTITSIESKFNVKISKKENGKWELTMPAPTGDYSNADAKPNYVEEPERLYGLIDELPPLKSGAYTPGDALRLIELAESLLRAAKELMKDSSDN